MWINLKTKAKLNKIQWNIHFVLIATEKLKRTCSFCGSIDDAYSILNFQSIHSFHIKLFERIRKVVDWVLDSKCELNHFFRTFRGASYWEISKESRTSFTIRLIIYIDMNSVFHKDQSIWFKGKKITWL